MRPDGLLYYQTSVWNAERPIDGASAYTDWPARSWTTINGDGCLTACGPGGMPMATLRLENYRDGLEDLAYVKLLKEKTGAEFPVPEDVMRSMTDFTLRPEPLMRWRESLADRLEGAR
jgi:hypothetical protein